MLTQTDFNRLLAHFLQSDEEKHQLEDRFGLEASRSMILWDNWSLLNNFAFEEQDKVYSIDNEILDEFLVKYNLAIFVNVFECCTDDGEERVVQDINLESCDLCGEPVKTHQSLERGFQLTLNFRQLIKFVNKHILSQEFDVQVSTLKDLKAHLPNLVLFVGSGISVPFHIPAWKDLIVHWKDTIKASSVGEFEALADENDIKSMIELLLRRSETIRSPEKLKENILSYIRDLISENAEDSNIQHNLLDILQLHCQTIVTTNYDDLLERNDADHYYLPTESCQLPSLTDLKKRPYILHIHGSINNYPKMILTSDDYDVYSGSAENKYLRQLQSLLGGNPILFIGFSGQDKAVMGQINEIIKASNESAPAYQVVFPGAQQISNDESNKRLIKIGISPKVMKEFDAGPILAIKVLLNFLSSTLFT
ncbi:MULTISPECIES: SIR2 family protein [Lacticaseibacillus]|uniref:SIR2 family protein n=1 Tax=Lacticaseibacillus TaxID=2759736 RepID=UPI00063DAC71|nr:MULTISPECIES: SIR2 family protein [Lacticaseibacillus]KLI76891.1 hypothetical protein AAW28_02415 [Lacticaseibacillus casei]